MYTNEPFQSSLYRRDPGTLAPRYGVSTEQPAEQYTSLRQVSRSPTAPAPLTSLEQENWDANLAAARDESSLAHTVIYELPNLQAQSRRAVANNDPVALAAVSKRIGEIINDQDADLAGWENLRYNGAEGTARSLLVRQVRSGQWRHDPSWGLASGSQTRTPADVEGADKQLAQELSITDDVAKAMVDRNDPRYALYGRFARFLRPLASMPSTGDQRADLARQAAYDQKSALLRATIRLEHRHSDMDPQELGELVEAFDTKLQGTGVTFGDSLLDQLVTGYREFTADGTPMSASEYVSKFSELATSLQPPDIKSQDGKEKTEAGRRAIHESHALAGALTAEAARLGVPDVLTDGVYRDTLAGASTTLRLFNQIYGVNVFDSKTGGTAKRAAQMALVRAGVPGADDGGLSGTIDAMSSTLSLMLSDPTRDSIKLAQAQNGTSTSSEVKPDNPYYTVEATAMRAAGTAMWQYMQRYGLSFPAMLRAMSAPGDMGDGDAMMAVVAAVERPLATRINDPELAHDVARELVLNMVGRENGSRKTLRDLLVEKSGLLRQLEATKSEGGALSAGQDFDSNDLALLARGEVIQTNPEYNQAFADAQRQLSLAIQKRVVKGKSDDYNMSVYKAAGRLYHTIVGLGSGSGYANELIASGYLGKLTAANEADRRFDWKDRNRLFGMYEDLVKRASDSDVSMAGRTEALASLIMAGAGARDTFVRTETSSPSPQSTTGVSFPVQTRRDLWIQVQAAARTLGVELPSDFKNYDAASLIRNLATTNPALAESDMVTSGYLDPRTGTASLKNMLRYQQAKSALDPLVNSGRADPQVTDSERAARRALGTFEQTRDSSVGPALHAYSQLLQAQGVTGVALLSAQAVAGQQLADAWRREGPTAVEQCVRTLMSHRRWFVPKVQLTTDFRTKKNIPVRVPNAVEPTRPMTELEYRAERMRLQRMYFDAGLTLTDQDFDDAVVHGPQQYNEGLRISAAAELAKAKREKPASPQ